MNPYGLVFLILLIVILLGWRQLQQLPPGQLNALVRKGLLYALAGVLIIAVLTGRAPWIMALIGAALPLAQRGYTLWRAAQLVKQFKRKPKPGTATAGSAGQTSQVRTDYLAMSLDHNSGEMDGEVLAGDYRGKRLSSLSLAELLSLYRACQHDSQSKALLEAYLDRHHSDWRDVQQKERKPSKGNLSRDEAYDILGLQPGASREEIISAHRRLMQKMHPDRGGSSYLAAQINQAKDILLGE